MSAVCTTPLHAASWVWKWEEAIERNDKAVGLEEVSQWRLAPRLRQAHEGGADVGLHAMVCVFARCDLACLYTHIVGRFPTNKPAVTFAYS